jgi:hypothetical protein
VSDTTIQSALTTALAVLAVGYGLSFALLQLRRRRPGLDIAGPLAFGVAVRLGAIVAVAATGLGSTLRGGDETTFMQNASSLATRSWGDAAWQSEALHKLHTAVFAAQIKIADLSEAALRVTQEGIAMLGILLIIAAVHDLAGPAAARLAAWVLALEPAGIFFDSALHKEPLMMLASGMVVLGGTWVWRQLSFRGVGLMAVGGFIAVATRSYAGWFLVSAGALVLLHAGLVRGRERPLRGMPVVYAVVIAGFFVVPTLTQVTSDESLRKLQISQDANTVAGMQVRTETDTNSNNLALERVDFSTRGKVFLNLPKRIRDVLLKPYPWQLDNTSQRLGAIGTLVAFAALIALLRYAWLARRRFLAITGPLLYPLIFLCCAYGLSAGNAGTGFRYRTHIVTLGLAMLIVLREHALRGTAPARLARPARPGRPGLANTRLGGAA